MNKDLLKNLTKKDFDKFMNDADDFCKKLMCYTMIVGASRKDIMGVINRGLCDKCRDNFYNMYHKFLDRKKRKVN